MVYVSTPAKPSCRSLMALLQAFGMSLSVLYATLNMNHHVTEGTYKNHFITWIANISSLYMQVNWLTKFQMISIIALLALTVRQLGLFSHRFHQVLAMGQDGLQYVPLQMPWLGFKFLIIITRQPTLNLSFDRGIPDIVTESRYLVVLQSEHISGRGSQT